MEHKEHSPEIAEELKIFKRAYALELIQEAEQIKEKGDNKHVKR